ncbi:heterokaryon incompatibility protein-domain-containing protein [Apiospora saccharicola]|uniref:Heterokaryon incompatibility protein-domain-containing protein n=1 Tax=Apiospora saccharicola TaxID=335842 RepID=A0ABR1W506_9PEZI
MANTSTNEEGHFCARCKSVRWAELARVENPGQVVMTVSESHEQLRSSACLLCGLLSTIKPPRVGREPTELRLFSTRDALALHSPYKRDIDGYVDGRCLSFSDSQDMLTWNDGFLALSDPSNPPDYDIRPLKPEGIDIDFIQECLGHCRRVHGRQCKSPFGSPPSKLRVIDCRRSDHQVVDAPRGCQYAALSYVWGSPQATTAGAQPTEGLPRVVVDAIEITTRLGFYYLWVDRYCINQNSKTDKHQQIQQMGEIYSHAEITLIAACGSDASCGLPGVGSTCRPVRRRLENHSFVLQEGARHRLDAPGELPLSAAGDIYRQRGNVSVQSHKLCRVLEDTFTFNGRSIYCAIRGSYAQTARLVWKLRK